MHTVAMRLQPLEDLVGDLRFAARMLRKQPLFSAAVVLMLAFGIGVNATVFSWLETVVLEPLPGVADPASLATIVQSDGAQTSLPLVSYPDFEELARTTQAFAGVVGTRATTALLDHHGRSEWISASVATADTFDVLGVRAESGRTFTREEDIGEGQHPVALLGHVLWQRDFGGDPSIVGQTVRVNQHAFTIVGIVPAAFHGVSGGSQIDLWVPLAMHDALLNFGSYTSRTFRWIQPLARLRGDVTAVQAQAMLAVLSARLAASYPDSNAGVDFRLFPLWKSPYGGQAAFLPVLQIVFAMTGGILLIVMANVACLLLSRATLRHTEVTIRVAIGAGRSRLIRQFLAESLMLATAGGAAGWLVARWAVQLLPRLMPTAIGFAYDFTLSARVAAFTIGLTLITTILFGFVPALTANDVDLGTSLKTRDGSGSATRRHRILAGLVITEVALALVLLVGAGLCVRGFQRAARIDVGFDPGGVVYAGLNLVPNGYTAERAKIFDQALRLRLQSLPGVSAAAFVNTAPLGASRAYTGGVDVEGRETRTSENRTVPFVIASPGYFSVMRIPVLDGRDFEESDDATRPHVAIVNDVMAKRYWPGLNPVGRRFRMAVGIAPSDTFLVVGVCGTSKYASLAEPPTPMVYVTYLQRPIASLFMNVVMRTTASADRSISALRDELHALDPNVEPLSAMSMDQYIQAAFMPVRIAATLLIIVGTAALALAAAGLYAVLSYVVNERTREIGIRLALGAQTGATVHLIVARGMGLVAIGVAIGQAISLATTRLLGRFLYGVSAVDPVTFITVAALLGVVALVACAVPALRVVRVDPVSAMRSE